MGFGTTPKRCETRSKSQPLLKKFCIFHAYETLTAYTRMCLRMHALAHVHRLLPMYTEDHFGILFPKINFCSFKKLHFSF